MSTLKVTVKETTIKGQKGLTGTYQLPNSTTAKVATKEGKSLFANYANLTQTARRLATSIGWTLQLDQPVKAAAKKSVKATTAKKASKPTAKRTASKTAPKAAPVASTPTCSK